MKKALLVWLSCACALAGQAQIEQDSVFRTKTLDEVVVKTSAKRAKSDGLSVSVTEELKAKSSNGLDLLSAMHLPRISVNQMTGSVSISGGGNVQLRKNGVIISSNELAGFSPADIVRVEYHDNAGAEYGDVGRVIDIITRKHETGGNLMANVFSGVGRDKTADFGVVGAGYNCGRSEWSWLTLFMYQYKDDWTRDYTEIRLGSSDNISLREEGAPTKARHLALNNSLNYRYDLGDKTFFNAKLNFATDNEPYSETGDRKTVFYSSLRDQPANVYEHTANRSVSPSLDLYLMHTLAGGARLKMDVLGTYISSRSKHLYQEKEADAEALEIFSDIHGDKYSLIAEVIYEQPLHCGTLMGGARQKLSYTDNRYSGDAENTVHIRQSETSIFGSYKYMTSTWTLRGGLEAKRIAFSQQRTEQEHWALNPRLSASWQAAKGLHLRYSADLDTRMPALSLLSDVEQQIDGGMVVRGNPQARPYHTLIQQFDASIGGRSWWDINLHTSYEHEYKPVMEQTGRENNIFVRTYNNQRSFSKTELSATLAARLFGEHISLALTPLFHHYGSRGMNYHHSRNLFRLECQFDASWHNWLLSYTTMWGPENGLYGETFAEEKMMHMVLAGYKWPTATVQVGCFNPFMKRYWMKSENLSALTPSKAEAHSGHNEYFTVKVALNLGFGRQKKSERNDIEHEDTDNGLLRGTRK